MEYISGPVKIDVPVTHNSVLQQSVLSLGSIPPWKASFLPGVQVVPKQLMFLKTWTDASTALIDLVAHLCEDSHITKQPAMTCSKQNINGALGSLPVEIHLSIIDYLDYTARVALAYTNRYFNEIVVRRPPTSREGKLKFVSEAETWPMFVYTS